MMITFDVMMRCLMDDFHYDNKVNDDVDDGI